MPPLGWFPVQKGGTSFLINAYYRTSKILEIMNTTSRTLPALEEIKNCEKAMNKINKKWFDNETQEQYFEARKQLWLYRKEMRMQAERLIKAIDEAEARDREHYAQNASSPNEKMMRDFILNDQ